MSYFAELMKLNSRLMFLGGAGSGKSELALNCAFKLAGLSRGTVHLFDLDQTKPLFRSREMEELLEAHKVILHYGQSMMDIPNLPAGVAEILLEPGMISVLDVGGNMAGARMAGQFMDYFKSPGSSVFYLINCYRPFAHGSQGIKDTLMGILEASGSGKPHVIANPNYGSDTTVNDVISGMEQTIDLLKETGLEAEALVMREDLLQDDILKCRPNIIPIKRYLNRFTG